MSLIYRPKFLPRSALDRLPRPALDWMAWHFIRSRVAKAGCWFVDLPRTSSNSIRQELWQEFGWPFNAKWGSEDYSFLPGISCHRKAREMRMHLRPLLWQKIFTFSVVRNPWDRYLSLFFFHFNTGFRLRLGSDPSIQYTLGEVKPIFNHWLSQFLLFRKNVWEPAEAYLLDKDGNMIVDFVAKYENRQADLAYIGKKINYPKLGQEQKLVEFTPKAYHYSEYYDSELRDFVAEIAKWEIEKFNYSFEQPSAQAESRQGGGG